MAVAKAAKQREEKMDRRKFLKHSSLFTLSLGAAWPRTLRAAAPERVLVIGAGMAGAGAANRLAAAGYNVTILEGRDRIGGRTWSDDSLGVTVDMGGQWLEGVDGNPMTALAQQYGLATFPDDGDYVVVDRRGRLYRNRELREGNQIYRQITRRAYERSQRTNRDMPFGRFLRQEFRAVARNMSRRQRQLVKWIINATITGDIAANPRYLSSWYIGEGDGFGGGSHFFPNGYGEIAERLIGGIDVRLSHAVRRISYTESGVEVLTDQGPFTADRVVVTLPLGVLKAGVVEFSPGLPADKLGALDRLDMGLLNKVVMRFPQNFWDEPGTLLSGIGNTRIGNGPRGEVPDFINLAPVVGEPVLFGIMGGDYAIWTEQLTDQELVDLAMVSLRRMFWSGYSGSNRIYPLGLDVGSVFHTAPTHTFQLGVTILIGTFSLNRWGIAYSLPVKLQVGSIPPQYMGRTSAGSVKQIISYAFSLAPGSRE